jgi:dihydrofolate synthase/folylpolyglutamate synthase
VVISITIILRAVDANHEDFLYRLKREGIKLDLSVTEEFANLLGNPQNSFQSIHVAGTNGKGSVSAYIYNVLRQKYRTGLYTSPHLIDFNERIVSGKDVIPDSYIEKFLDAHKEKIEELSRINRNPTFFEVTTLLAFCYFRDTACRYAAVEVGLGGRLDSTNIILPLISVITQIGFEHADKLGGSLTAISYEKGGIIKSGIPVVLGDNKPEVVRTITSIAQRRNSRMLTVEADTKITELDMSIEGNNFTLETPANSYRIKSPLIGQFQVRNIATSVLAVENSGIKIGKRNIEKGIWETRWPARMEIIRKDPMVMVDSAHNPPAAVAISSTLRKITDEKPLLLVGMLSDKDPFSFLSELRKISENIVFTTPEEPLRSIDPDNLQRLYGNMFANSRSIRDPYEAYDYCLGKGQFLLVTGSMYLVGLIKKIERSPVIPYAPD